MRNALSVVIVLLAILDAVLGFGFLSNPAQSGESLGVTGGGAMGLSTMRGDFTAFFWVAAGFMAAGAWKKRGDWLVAPLALFLIAVSGRALNLLLVGAYAGWWVPMAVETLHVAMLAAAIRVFPWRPARGG